MNTIEQTRELYQRDTPWMQLASSNETHTKISNFQSKVIRCGEVQYTLYSANVVNTKTHNVSKVTRTDKRIQNCIIKSTGWYATH